MEYDWKRKIRTILAPASEISPNELKTGSKNNETSAVANLTEDCDKLSVEDKCVQKDECCVSTSVVTRAEYYNRPPEINMSRDVAENNLDSLDGYDPVTGRSLWKGKPSKPYVTEIKGNSVPEWKSSRKQILGSKIVKTNVVKRKNSTSHAQRPSLICDPKQILKHPAQLRQRICHEKHVSAEEKHLLDIIQQSKEFKVKKDALKLNDFDGAGLNCFKAGKSIYDQSAYSYESESPSESDDKVDKPPLTGFVSPSLTPYTYEAMLQTEQYNILTEVWDEDDEY